MTNMIGFRSFHSAGFITAQGFLMERYLPTPEAIRLPEPIVQVRDRTMRNLFEESLGRLRSEREVEHHWEVCVSSTQKLLHDNSFVLALVVLVLVVAFGVDVLIFTLVIGVVVVVIAVLHLSQKASTSLTIDLSTICLWHRDAYQDCEGYFWRGSREKK